MKRATMIVCLGVLAASPALAYVQPGTYVYATDSQGSIASRTLTRDGDGFKVPEIVDDAPTSFPYSVQRSATPMPASPALPSQPVPEPGTMAMASMGLLALGATLRRRRGR